MSVYAVENRRSTWYIGVKRTKNGISEYGEHAADDVSACGGRICDPEERNHTDRNKKRYGYWQ